LKNFRRIGFAPFAASAKTSSPRHKRYRTVTSVMVARW
jgi:hypothetical protein